MASITGTRTSDLPSFRTPAFLHYARTLLGGLLAGIGGAYFSLAITPNWIDGMTSGAGWIAIALVIFAFWRPELTLVGAYLFGLFSSLGFVLQAGQVHLPPEVFAALPYVMTVVVLVAVSTGWTKQRLGAPAALGTPYVREERQLSRERLLDRLR
jgi:general nucleoside transport system permease protein